MKNERKNPKTWASVGKIVGKDSLAEKQNKENPRVRSPRIYCFARNVLCFFEIVLSFAVEMRTQCVRVSVSCEISR